MTGSQFGFIKTTYTHEIIAVLHVGLKHSYLLFPRYSGGSVQEARMKFSM